MKMMNDADEVVGVAIGTEVLDGDHVEDVEDVSGDSDVIEDDSGEGVKLNKKKKKKKKGKKNKKVVVVEGEEEIEEEEIAKVEEEIMRVEVEEEIMRVEVEEEIVRVEVEEGIAKVEKEEEEEDEVKEEPPQEQPALQQQQEDVGSGVLGQSQGSIEENTTTKHINETASPGRGNDVRHAVTSAEKKASSYMMDSRKAWDLSVAVGAEESKNAEITSVIPYETLKEMRAEDGIDMTRKECYLSSEEFQSCFNQDLEAFNKLPMWRRILLKKKVGLF